MLERCFFGYKFCSIILWSFVGDDLGKDFGRINFFFFPCVFQQFCHICCFKEPQVLATRGREGRFFDVLQVLQQQIRSAQEAMRNPRT